MNLSNMMDSLRIELQDTTKVVYSEDELMRATEKCVSLLSRFLPKRSIVETTLTRVVSGETLAIASGTGTLAYKPVKKGTLTITGKTLDTDYQINYLTGVVTEIGSGLPDGNYTATYELDPNMLDLSSIVTDYIKLERVEYPVGNFPPTLVTYDVLGSYLLFRGSTSLTDKDHLRVVYLERWNAPTVDTDGNYPSHLDDPIIIGSAGQALIFKAEKYMKDAIATVEDVITLLSTLDSISLVDPNLTPPTPPTLDVLVVPTDYVYVKPTVPVLPTAPTKPAAPTLTDLTPPAAYTFVKPAKPSLGSAPTPPAAPTLTFTDFDACLALAETAFGSASSSLGAAATALGLSDSALDKVAAEVAAAKTHLTNGVSLINAATRGDEVGRVYGEYASHQSKVASGYAEEAMIWNDLVAKHIAQGDGYAEVGGRYIADALAEMDKVKANLSKYQLQLESYRGEVDSYAATIAAQENAFQTEVAAENAGISNFSALVNKYQQEINEEILKVSKYSEELRAYTSEVAVYGTDCSFKISVYQGELQAESLGMSNFNNLIAKYRALQEYNTTKVAKYAEDVRGFTASVQEYAVDADAFQTKVTAVINRATQLAAQVTNYINIAGRYLASGQAKINEFLAALGVKPEFSTQKASTEQRT